MIEEIIKAKYKGGIAISLILPESTYLIKDLICNLCKDLAYEVCLCLFCESAFCNVCIKRWLIRHSTCPSCRHTYSNEFLHQSTQSIINNKVKMNCLYHREGCNKISSYGTFFDHLKKCKYANPLTRPRKMKSKSPKKAISNSLSNTLRREIFCVVCSEYVVQDEFHNHNEGACLDKLLNQAEITSN